MWASISLKIINHSKLSVQARISLISLSVLKAILIAFPLCTCLLHMDIVLSKVHASLCPALADNVPIGQRCLNLIDEDCTSWPGTAAQPYVPRYMYVRACDPSCCVCVRRGKNTSGIPT